MWPVHGLVRTDGEINESPSDIASGVTVEANGSPFFGGATTYPILTIPLRIISKVRSTLTIDEIVADVYFGGLFVGPVRYLGANDEAATVKRTDDKRVSLQFAPPVQVFLYDLSTCQLRDGKCRLHCPAGEVVLKFTTDPKEAENWERLAKAVKETLKRVLVGGL